MPVALEAAIFKSFIISDSFQHRKWKLPAAHAPAGASRAPALLDSRKWMTETPIRRKTAIS